MPAIIPPDPPLPPWQTLLTMYDLPSEALEEPGLPDEFPRLAAATIEPYLTPECLCYRSVFHRLLYYDSAHPQWYKRPNWFLSVDVTRLYQGDLRRSYVIWQERRAPFVVVELLSPGTEKEDLGPYAESESVTLEALPQIDQTAPTTTQPANGQALGETAPAKWVVYEQILRVPYYFVFSRYTNSLRFFQLVGGHYQEQSVDPVQPRLWLPELNIGLGLWQGAFEGISRLWLRWYDGQHEWITTDTEQALEQAEQERRAKEQALQRANQAEAQLQQVARHLLQSGSSIAQVSQLTGLAERQLQQFQEE